MNPRILEAKLKKLDLSHNRSCINLSVDSLLHRIFASKNRQVNHRFPRLSTVLCGKTQSWPRHTIQLLEDFDMFLHFFSGSRHRRFEDVQAMVDLIGDPVQISGLSSDLILYHSLLPSLCDLLCDLCTFQHPFTPSCTSIQREWTDTIRRCNEASTLSRKEVFLNGLPIDGQGFTHTTSLYPLSCTMQAFFESMIRGCHDLPPSLSGSTGGGGGKALRIGIMTTNQRSNQ